VAGTQDVRRAIADSLTSMELIAVTGLDRHIGYWKPYATSHDVLDGDLALQEEVRNTALGAVSGGASRA
jgi:hypothetical protein